MACALKLLLTFKYILEIYSFTLKRAYQDLVEILCSIVQICTFSKIKSLCELTCRSSCLGMMVMRCPSMARILPWRFINSPSQTSMLSPALNECPGPSSLPPVGSSMSIPSGASSNFSSSDKVGFTPKTHHSS